MDGTSACHYADHACDHFRLVTGFYAADDLAIASFCRGREPTTLLMLAFLARMGSESEINRLATLILGGRNCGLSSDLMARAVV